MSFENADKYKGEDSDQQGRCLHDPRVFLNCMPASMSPELLRDVEGFHPTCPYFAVKNSEYCRVHTIMNNAVTPEIAADINEWIGYIVRLFAHGYTVFYEGQAYQDKRTLHARCTNGTL